MSDLREQSDPGERKPRASYLDMLLEVFAEVHAGEGATVVLLMLDVFAILTSYYLIKPVREALILAIDRGAEWKIYMSAAQSVALLGVVPAYTWLATRMSSRRLINSVSAGFVACLLGFYALSLAGVPLARVFYVWVGLFNVMVIAQFWSFANEVYSEDRGRRLFAIVGFGQSLGALLGSVLAGWLIGPLGVYQLLPVAAGLLAVSLVLTNLVTGRRGRRGGADPIAEAAAAAPVGTTAATAAGNDAAVATGGPLRAFQLVVRERYLLLIALLILTLNWVNTTGEYILSSVVEDAAKSAVEGAAVGIFIGDFYARFFAVVNLVSLAIQALAVSRILKYFGVRAALLFLPVIAACGYLLVVVYPVLGFIRWVKTAENATDYSLQNTLRAVLFLPTSREEKYVAKQAIDTFFVRTGDVLSALGVLVGTTWLRFTTTSFALVNLGFVAAWLVLAALIGRRYRELARTPPGAAEAA